MSRIEALVLGVFLVAVGLVTTLGNVGWLDTLRALRVVWPLSLIFWGAMELVESRRRARS